MFDIMLDLSDIANREFEILFKNKYIDKETYENMKGMIGFRNIVVHDYQESSDSILQNVIENHLNDLVDFARNMIKKIS